MNERRPPSSERLRRMASHYEASVPEARAEQLAARAVARARAAQPQRRPLAAMAAALSGVFVFVTGLGFASADALPGDPLYGVSRAYEAVGTWVGAVDPVEARLEEAIALAERGDRDRAVQAINEALERIARDSTVAVALPQVTPDSDPVAEAETATAETEATTSSTVPPTTEGEAGITAQTEDPAPEAEVAPAGDEATESLRLAAESLLRSVRSAKDDPAAAEQVDDAAAQLAAIVLSIGSESDDLAAPTTTTSSTTSTTAADEATDPTVAVDPVSETTTTTTSTTSTTSTTTTTEPGGGDDGDGQDTGSGEDDGGSGPIFLPPES